MPVVIPTSTTDNDLESVYKIICEDLTLESKVILLNKTRISPNNGLLNSKVLIGNKVEVDGMFDSDCSM